MLEIEENVREEVQRRWTTGVSGGKNTYIAVQVLEDKELCKQPRMQASWADTPTATTNRVAKTRRGLTIMA